MIAPTLRYWCRHCGQRVYKEEEFEHTLPTGKIIKVAEEWIDISGEVNCPNPFRSPHQPYNKHREGKREIARLVGVR